VSCSPLPSTVTPGISALEYHHRRTNLAKALPKNSIAVLASSDIKYRSGAVFYEFHQEPNFFYLTGKYTRLCPCRDSPAETQSSYRLQRARSPGSHWCVRRRILQTQPAHQLTNLQKRLTRTSSTPSTSSSAQRTSRPNNGMVPEAESKPL
jgi:hypothetical protein